MAVKYKAQADFWFIYGREEHPSAFALTSKGRVASRPASNWEERCAHARMLADDHQSVRRILVDQTGAQSAQHLYGGFANGLVVIGVDKRVGLVLPWINPTALAKFLPAYLDRGGTYDPGIAVMARSLDHSIPMTKELQDSLR